VALLDCNTHLVSAAQKYNKDELLETCVSFFLNADIICWRGKRIVKCFSSIGITHMKHRLRRSILDLQEETEDINDKYVEMSGKHDYDPVLVNVDEYFADELREKVVTKLSRGLGFSVRRANEYYQSLRGTMIVSVLYLNSINKLHWEIERSEMHNVAATLRKCVSLTRELVALSKHLYRINSYREFYSL